MKSVMLKYVWQTVVEILKMNSWVEWNLVETLDGMKFFRKLQSKIKRWNLWCKLKMKWKLKWWDFCVKMEFVIQTADEMRTEIGEFVRAGHCEYEFDECWSWVLRMLILWELIIVNGNFMRAELCKFGFYDYESWEFKQMRFELWTCGFYESWALQIFVNFMRAEVCEHEFY